MGKTEGCWANVLDNCKGALSGEHLISSSLFSAAPGRPNNRSGKGSRRVEVQGAHHLQDGVHLVRDLKAPILCTYHNNSTSILDQEGSHVIEAIEGFNRTDLERSWLPSVKWNPRTYSVKGLHFQRLLLKLAVNNSSMKELPIGGSSALPGWPTRELVEMIYGVRPIQSPAGLFLLAADRMKIRLDQESFEPIFFDNGEYVEGCVWMLRNMPFGVQFTNDEQPERMFDQVAQLRGVERIQPFNSMTTPQNVELRILW